MSDFPDTEIICFPGGTFYYSQYYGSVAIVQAWRGVNQSDPVETLTTAKGYNSGIFVCPSVQPLTQGAMIVACGLSPATPGYGLLPVAPADYSNAEARVWKFSGIGGAGIRAGVASKAWDGINIENPGAWATDTTKAESWVAATFALKPA